MYAIGTHIATCKKQPALGLVCKLTEIDGVPRMKFSADAGKATLPGNKVVYRVWTGEGERAAFDLISLQGEEVKVGIHRLFNLRTESEEEHKIVKMMKLNEVMDISQFSHTLLESKECLVESVRELPERVFDLKEATRFEILMTGGFLEVFRKARDGAGVKHV